MKEAFEFAKITLRQSVRVKSFYGALIMTLVAIVGLFILHSFAMFEIPRILMNYVLSYTNLIVLLLVFLTFFSLIQYDIDRKTMQYIVALPMRRRDYILGRYFGLMAFSFIVSYGIVILFYPFLIILIKQRPDAPFSSIRYFLYPLFLLLEVSLISSFALLFTTLSTKSIISILSTLGVYFIGHSLDDVREFILTGYGSDVPLFSKILIKTAWYLFPNLSVFDVKITMTYNLRFTLTEAFIIVGYGILYTVAILLITLSVFDKKEIL